MTIAGWIFFGIFIVRGVFGFVQDANYWYKKEFNKENWKGWLDTFKRKEKEEDK